MISRHEVLISLYGVWRLFIRDPRGVDWLDDSIDGYWKSFFCALLILPGYIVWVALGSGELYKDAGFLRIVSVEAIAYVIGWVAWPLVMAYIAPAIGKDNRYIRYIVAFNWSAAIQIVLYLLVLFLGVVVRVPPGFAAFFAFFVLIVTLVYHWFILRVALEASPGGAVGLVIGELVLGQFIRGMSQGMLH
jgi:hypothetical protein